MSSDVAVPLTGILVASACALLGNFLILRRMAMMADAISHAILPGLVAGYVLAQGPNLLAGIIGATIAAAITVTAVQALERTRRVDGAAAIGIVFPAMFALGTVLVTSQFANVHLDADAILFGSIEFVAFDTLEIGGRDLGPQSIWVMSALCLINLLFVGFFYKELKLSTFDPGLAAALGFSPVILHYALMFVLSITSVGAFSAVGAVLVVALVIVPAATAYLLTDRLALMIPLSVIIGAVSALIGYNVAIVYDASIAGAMVSATGALFALALLFSPTQGLVARALQTRRNRATIASEMLVVHLFNHESGPDHDVESSVEHLSEGLRWDPARTELAISGASRRGWIERSNGHLELTDPGRITAHQVLAR
jgi:manganese/zinc/iron transport system permease protein